MNTLEAAKRVKRVADGETINGAYRMMPMAALQAFRNDLSVLVDHIITEGEGS